MKRNVRSLFFYKRIFIKQVSTYSSDSKNTGDGFYDNVKQHYSKLPATTLSMTQVNGVSDIDLQGSQEFIQEILSSENPPGTKLVLDVGAGIGRVAKNILINIFDKVDLLEPVETFVNFAVKSIGEDNEKLGSVYRTDIRNFYPYKKYDVIWVQWLLMYLNDDDTYQLIARCRNALNTNGVIFVKENVIKDGLEKIYSKTTAGVIRPHDLYVKIFDKAKLKIIRTESQKGLPNILTLQMFALVPLLKED